MSAPILFPMVTRYPRQRALSLWVGLAMTVLGFVLASFATKVDIAVISINSGAKY